MNGLIPKFNTEPLNDLTEKRSMSVIYRIEKESADGKKEIFEKSLDYAFDEYRKGRQWLNTMPATGKEEEHLRDVKNSLLVRQKHIIDDGKGNRITDEQAIKTDDFQSMHGTKLIRSDLNIIPDKREKLLEKFASKANPFQMLGNKQTQTLLDSKTDFGLISQNELEQISNE
jgi:hypothetical protein